MRDFYPGFGLISRRPGRKMKISAYRAPFSFKSLFTVSVG